MMTAAAEMAVCDASGSVAAETAVCDASVC